MKLKTALFLLFSLIFSLSTVNAQGSSNGSWAIPGWLLSTYFTYGPNGGPWTETGPDPQVLCSDVVAAYSANNGLASYNLSGHIVSWGFAYACYMYEDGVQQDNHPIYINPDCSYGLWPVTPTPPDGLHLDGGSPNTGMCACLPPDRRWYAAAACYNPADRYHDDQKCPDPKTPHSIHLMTGNNRLDIDIGNILSRQFSLNYDSKAMVAADIGASTDYRNGAISFGHLWQGGLHKSLIPNLNSTGIGTILASRGRNEWISFSRQSSSTTFSSDIKPADRIISINSPAQGYILIDAENASEELYDTAGNLLRIVPAQGFSETYAYSTVVSSSIPAVGLLVSVTTDNGRSIQFSYSQQTFGISVASMTTEDGSVVSFGYDQYGNLSQIVWPDGSAQGLLYEYPAHAWALSGIVDKSNVNDPGKRYATYQYDSNGYPNFSGLAGGVDAYSVSYASAPSQSAVLNYDATTKIAWLDHYWNLPSGITMVGTNATSTYGATSVGGIPRMSSSTQPAGSGCGAASNNVTYDASSNLASSDDFNGNRACYSYDLRTNNRTVSLEGLPNTKACPQSLSAYWPDAVDGRHPERKVTTVWHPIWKLKQQEAEPNKITTWVYNGTFDGISGGAALCAPSAPMLPDGSVVPVLCSRYEQATSDATGALGVAARVTGATRVWTYTYNQFGQVLTETTPRQSPTDPLSHTTTYAYYAATSFSGGGGYTMGDLQSVTNPLGQVTNYTSYDQAGRLLSSTDPNGTVTTQTYWPRGWLQTQTVTPASGSALTTTYDYWPTGLLKTVTMPDAAPLNYVYDDAHRLTDVIDAAGNKVHYVLDNDGNRTSEQISDASGNLASSVARVYDALKRVQSTTGAMH